MTQERAELGVKLIDQLRKLIVDVTNIKVNPEDISAESPLFRTGLGLDSIDLLEVLAHVEQRWGLRLSNDAAGQKALGSISTLSNAIGEHIAKA